ncbi:MAG: hypothetical protein RIC14_04800 [Filomicrobium sp.]
MAEIIDFAHMREALGSRAVRSGPGPHETTGEIVLFTGIQYERHEVPPPTIDPVDSEETECPQLNKKTT